MLGGSVKLDSYDSTFTIFGDWRCRRHFLVRQHHGQEEGERAERGGEVPEIVVVEEVEDEALAAQSAGGGGRDGRRVGGLGGDTYVTSTLRAQ